MNKTTEIICKLDPDIYYCVYKKQYFKLKEGYVTACSLVANGCDNAEGWRCGSPEMCSAYNDFPVVKWVE